MLAEECLNNCQDFVTGHNAIILEVASQTLAKALKQFYFCETFSRATHLAEVHEALHKVLVQDKINKCKFKKDRFDCLLDWLRVFSKDTNYWEFRQRQWHLEPGIAAAISNNTVHINTNSHYALKFVPVDRRETTALVQVILKNNIATKELLHLTREQIHAVAGEIFHTVTDHQIWIDLNNRIQKGIGAFRFCQAFNCATTISNTSFDNPDWNLEKLEFSDCNSGPVEISEKSAFEKYQKLAASLFGDSDSSDSDWSEEDSEPATKKPRLELEDSDTKDTTETEEEEEEKKPSAAGAKIKCEQVQVQSETTKTKMKTQKNRWQRESFLKFFNSKMATMTREYKVVLYKTGDDWRAYEAKFLAVAESRGTHEVHMGERQPDEFGIDEEEVTQ